MNCYKLAGPLLGFIQQSSSSCPELTSDEHDDQPGDVFPEQLVPGHSAAELLVVDDVGGHVAGEAVRDVYGKGEHQLGALSQSDNIT